MLRVQRIKLSFAISWAVLSCTQVLALPVNSLLLAQNPTLNPRGQLNESLIFAAPPPPPDIGEPGQRSEAGSRGCEDIDKPLTSDHKRLKALVPVYSNSDLVLGATISPAPTFWFYIPYTQFRGKFVLQDKDGRLVYQTDVMPQTPGVVSLSLPGVGAPLLIGKPYRWFLKIYRKAQAPPAFVEGWIQRNSLNPVLKSQLEKATPRSRVALYAANGIWYEALTASAELYRTDPNRGDWAAMLRTIGLDDIASEPMLECCHPRN